MTTPQLNPYLRAGTCYRLWNGRRKADTQSYAVPVNWLWNMAICVKAHIYSKRDNTTRLAWANEDGMIEEGTVWVSEDTYLHGIITVLHLNQYYQMIRCGFLGNVRYGQTPNNQIANELKLFCVDTQFNRPNIIIKI